MNKDLFIALLATLVWAPLPHGGERFWEIGPVAAVSFLLLAIWSFRQWRSNAPLPPVVRNNRLPLMLLVAWLLYVLFQAIPLPFDMLKSLSPHAAELKATVAFADAVPPDSLSIDPGSTLVEFIKYASYIALFFLALVLTDSRKRLTVLALTLFFTGLALSFYSIFNHYTNGLLSFNQPLPPWGAPGSRSVRGTYSQYNYFAGLLELTIPVGIGLVVAHVKPGPNRWSLRTIMTDVIDVLFSRLTVYLFFTGLMVSTLLLTTSRGGNGAFFISFLLITLYFMVSAPTEDSSNRRKLTVSFIIATIVVSAISSASLLTARLEKQGLQDSGRSLMWSSAYTIVSLYPIWGSGPGTYPQLQESYKNPRLGTSQMWKHAHSDYLELYSDQGTVGFTLLGLFVFFSFVTILSGIRKRRDPLELGLLFAAATGVLSSLIHATAELNFHLPANAIYFWILLAIGLVSSSMAVSARGSD